jgi:hypothetical protein
VETNRRRSHSIACKTGPETMWDGVGKVETPGIKMREKPTVNNLVDREKLVNVATRTGSWEALQLQPGFKSVQREASADSRRNRLSPCHSHSH